MLQHPTPNNPRIQRPSTCCSYCGKVYQRQHSLNRHLVSCPVFLQTQREAPQPTYVLQDMIKSLALKHEQLHAKVAGLEKEVHKWRHAALRQTHTYSTTESPAVPAPISPEDWLKQRNTQPESTVATWMQRVQISETVLVKLRTAELLQVMADLLTPCDALFAVTYQRHRLLYAFLDDHPAPVWKKITDDALLQKWFAQLQSKLLRYAMDWNKEQKARLQNNRIALEPVNAMTDELICKITEQQTAGTRFRTLLHATLLQHPPPDMIEFW